MNVQKNPTAKCDGRDCCGAKRKAFQRLLVAIDSGDQSEFAAGGAAKLCEQLHADVVLLNVFSTACLTCPETSYMQSDLREISTKAGNELLARVKARMSASAKVGTVVGDGDPITEISNAAKFYDIDLIIMGHTLADRSHRPSSAAVRVRTTQSKSLTPR